MPLFGSGLASKSFVVTRQKRVNCYYELRQDGDKSSVVVYGTPGMTFRFSAPTNVVSPARGMLGWDDKLYIVSYNEFLEMTPAGAQTYSNMVGTITGNVSLSANNHQLIIVDGTGGYLYTPSGPTFATIAPSFPNGAKTVTYVQGFFVAEQPGTQNYWVSNANDGSVWGGTAFNAASQYADFILAVDNLYGNLLVFSEQHLEWHQNTGAIPQPFAAIQSATQEYGLAAIFSRAHVNNTIAFLAQSPQGQAQVCAFNGYQPYVISTPDVDSLINGFATISDAVALSYLEGGHPFYQLTFPSANRSFLYDFSTEMWSYTQTGIPEGRHIANLSATLNNQTYLSDYQNSNIYRPDPTNLTDNGETILREIITRHASKDFNEFAIDEIYLDMETGVSELAGNVPPQVMLQISRDNGRTWEPERWAPMGMQGHYRSRVIWRRCGSARDFVARFRLTDLAPFVITSGAATMRERQQGTA